MDKIKYRIRSLTLFGVVLLLVVTAFFACRRSDRYRDDHGVAPCEITGALDSLFTPMFAGNEPGAIVTVMRGDTIVYNHAYGLARLDSISRVSDQTLFNLSSASKVFTTAALLKLAEEGQISLDDSLSRFFPEFSGDFFNKITVFHILTHSSGLPDLRPHTSNDWSDYLSRHSSIFAQSSDYSLYGTESEHMQVFQNLDRVSFEPGTHYESQDPAFILVAPLIERVTGENFDDWMQANIFAPAGMTETFYYQPDVERANMAHGYKRADSRYEPLAFRSKDGRWDEYDYGEADYFLTKADRGAYSSSRDFMRFKRALYGGRVVADSMLVAMNKPYIATEIPMVSFGLGGAVRLEPGLPAKSYHLNSNGGFSIVEGCWPDKKLHYLVFSNRNDWDLRGVTASIDSIFKTKRWL